MRYYATASGPAVREAMRAGRLGMIATPAAGNRVESGVAWIADNSAYTGRYPATTGTSPGSTPVPSTVDSARSRPHPTCLAMRRRPGPGPGRSCPASAPSATPPRSSPKTDWNTSTSTGTSSTDCFWARSTAWKLGPAAAQLAAHARALDLHVHVGRVNSLRRLCYAAGIGAHSADGTYLAYGPRRNLPKLLGWLDQVNAGGPDGTGQDQDLVAATAHSCTGPPPEPGSRP